MSRMTNPGRWRAVDPEPAAPRPEHVASPEPDPEPAPAPDAGVDLAEAERAEEVEPAQPRRAEAAAGTVEIEAVLTEEEYRQLLAAAAAAGKTPNDFLRQAVRDAWFFRHNAPPGSKILIVSGGKVHTVR